MSCSLSLSSSGLHLGLVSLRKGAAQYSLSNLSNIVKASGERPCNIRILALAIILWRRS
jgi:hypothetical protein